MKLRPTLLLLLALLLTGCGGSIPRPPAMPGLPGTSTPLPRDRNEISSERDRVATELAAKESELATLRERARQLEQAEREAEARAHRAWMRWIGWANIVLAGILVGLAMWLPLGRRALLGAAGICGTIGVLATLTVELAPYVLWIGGAVLVALVAFFAWLFRRNAAALRESWRDDVNDLRDLSDTARAAVVPLLPATVAGKGG